MLRGGPAPARPAIEVSEPGDALEKEADRVADRVMGMAVPEEALDPGGNRPGAVRRAAGDGSLQRLESPEAQSANGPSSGGPLPDTQRRFFESRFGEDFSAVRIHDDPAAHRLSSTFNARAFTRGREIVFAKGEYQPGSEEGKRLIAHELAHVVQQGSDGGGRIQREVDPEPGGEGAGPAADPRAQLRRGYIELACDVIDDIRQAVEEGRVWPFEDPARLQGEGGAALVQQRYQALQQLVADLGGIIDRLNSGALEPSQPASRDSLRALWTVEHRTGRVWDTNDTPAGHPANWSNPTRIRTLPSGEIRRTFQSLGGYINFDSVAGPLQGVAFPTWWVLGCHDLGQAPAAPERVIPADLPRDSVIFIYRERGVVTRWDWEPRQESYTEASRPFGPYEWHYDEADRRVYIVVNGQELNLLRNSRVQAQGR